MIFTALERNIPTVVGTSCSLLTICTSRHILTIFEALLHLLLPPVSLCSSASKMASLTSCTPTPVSEEHST